MALIDREIFFDNIRPKPFANSLTQDQVDGMNAILDAWEADYSMWDLRWLAYALATTAHETGMEMLPIEEYGKGKGQPYGEPDPITGECYYGRGYVQLTWDSNYQRADSELDMVGDDSCYLHPERQLEPEVAAPTMFIGMRDGWFRGASDGSRETLQKYFNDTRDDPFGAREIINGDKNTVPSWSNGVSIGNLIKGYHKDFLKALQAAYVEEDAMPEPTPAPAPSGTVTVTIESPAGVKVVVNLVETKAEEQTATTAEVDDDEDFG